MAKKNYISWNEIMEEYHIVTVLTDESGVPENIVYTLKNGRLTCIKRCLIKGPVLVHSGTQSKYYYFRFYNQDTKRYLQIPVHDLVWLMAGRTIEVGKELDHINDNSLDNRLENLQLVTHAENIRKRNHGIGVNQYTCNLTTEEIMVKRSKRLEELEKIKQHSIEVKERSNRIKFLKSKVDEAHAIFMNTRRDEDRDTWKLAVFALNNYKKEHPKTK